MAEGVCVGRSGNAESTWLGSVGVAESNVPGFSIGVAAAACALISASASSLGTAEAALVPVVRVAADDAFMAAVAGRVVALLEGADVTTIVPGTGRTVNGAGEETVADLAVGDEITAE